MKPLKAEFDVGKIKKLLRYIKHLESKVRHLELKRCIYDDNSMGCSVYPHRERQ